MTKNEMALQSIKWRNYKGCCTRKTFMRKVARNPWIYPDFCWFSIGPFRLLRWEL